jgi:hypothetical protein
MRHASRAAESLYKRERRAMTKPIVAIVQTIVVGAVVYGAIAQYSATERARIEAQTQRAFVVVLAGKTTKADVNFQTGTTNSRKEELPVSSGALDELAKGVSGLRAAKSAQAVATRSTD